MKLTKEELKLFKEIQGTELGDGLKAYFERLSDWVCDIRNLPAPSPEAIMGARIAAKVLDDFVIQRLRRPKEAKEVKQNEYI